MPCWPIKRYVHDKAIWLCTGRKSSLDLFYGNCVIRTVQWREDINYLLLNLPTQPAIILRGRFNSLLLFCESTDSTDSTSLVSQLAVYNNSKIEASSLEHACIPLLTFSHSTRIFNWNHTFGQEPVMVFFIVSQSSMCISWTRQPEPGSPSHIRL